MNLAKQVAATLRQCARLLRNSPISMEPGDESPYARWSGYICDVLAKIEQEGKAHRYLKGLGMGQGFQEFFDVQSRDFTEEQQCLRVAWLYFAADLAEEFGDEWVSDVALPSSKE